MLNGFDELGIAFGQNEGGKMRRGLLKMFLVGIAFLFGGASVWGSGWLYTDSMNVSRQDHTASLLPDPWGKVLVTGGYNGSYLAQSELYDPVTHFWASTGSMALSRRYHTMTPLTQLLPNRVMVTGGYSDASADLYLRSCEVYNPATHLWTGVDSMNIRRMHHTATEVTSGNVVVIGGRNAEGVLSSCEYWEGTRWYSVMPMNHPRELHTATLLENGKIFVAGGKDMSGWLSSCEIYDPAADRWTMSAATIDEGYHTATLHSGWYKAAGNSPYEVDVDYVTLGKEYDPKILIAGSYGCQLYNCVTDETVPTASMNTWREYHTATLLDRPRILVIGGRDAAGDPIDSCEIYNPMTELWSVVAATNTGRVSHTATLFPFPSKCKGNSPYEVDVDDVTLGYEYDPSWQILVAGGHDGINYLSSCEIIDEDVQTTGTISGKVLNVSGDPVEPFSIVIAYNGGTCHAVTDSLGDYTLQNLPLGIQYFVCAFAPGYIGEYYDDVYTPESAVQVTPNSQNIDFEVVAAEKDGSGGLSGTIKGDGGSDLQDAMVYAIRSSNAVGCARSASDGTYLIQGINPGAYTVTVSRPGYGSADFPQYVEVGDTVVQGIDVTLTLTGVEEDSRPHDRTETRSSQDPELTISPSLLRGTARIRYQVPTANGPESVRTSLRIYDLSGRVVEKLVDQEKTPGCHEAEFDAGDCTTGIYFARLQVGGRECRQKFILVK